MGALGTTVDRIAREASQSACKNFDRSGSCVYRYKSVLIVVFRLQVIEISYHLHTSNTSKKLYQKDYTQPIRHLRSLELMDASNLFLRLVDLI